MRELLGRILRWMIMYRPDPNRMVLSSLVLILPPLLHFGAQWARKRAEEDSPKEGRVGSHQHHKCGPEEKLNS